jgi:hypothetical protein
MLHFISIILLQFGSLVTLIILILIDRIYRTYVTSVYGVPPVFRYFHISLHACILLLELNLKIRSDMMKTNI